MVIFEIKCGIAFFFITMCIDFNNCWLFISWLLKEEDRVETDVGSELAVSPEQDNVSAIRDITETLW